MAENTFCSCSHSFTFCRSRVYRSSASSACDWERSKNRPSGASSPDSETSADKDHGTLIFTVVSYDFLVYSASTLPFSLKNFLQSSNLAAAKSTSKSMAFSSFQISTKLKNISRATVRWCPMVFDWIYSKLMASCCSWSFFSAARACLPHGQFKPINWENPATLSFKQLGGKRCLMCDSHRRFFIVFDQLRMIIMMELGC